MFQRIVLFKPSMDSGIDSRIKYVLIFELSEIEEKYKDLIWRQEKLPDIIDGHGHLWIANDVFFREVYVEAPAGNPENEWLIKCALPGDLSYTSLVVSEPKVTLSPRDEISIGQSETNSFILMGDVWLVNFEGKETIVKNIERIRYIVNLIDNPGVEIESHDLVRIVKSKGTDANQANNNLSKDYRLEEEGLRLAELNIEELSKEEKEKLENIAYNAWEKVYAPSPGTADHQIAKKEWMRTKNYFLNEHGIKIIGSSKGLKFERHSRLNPDAAKLRQLAQKQIKTAIEDFKGQIPSLYEHLTKYIKTGARCIYHIDKENPLEWKIKR